MMRQFWDAVAEGDIEEIQALLRNNPSLDVNQGDDKQWTALHFAVTTRSAETAKLLLAQTTIDVNVQDVNGFTPLFIGCEGQSVPLIRLLLKDPRVDVTLADEDGMTPLWWAANRGYCDMVEWFIASGRDLGDFAITKGLYGNFGYTTLEIAREKERPDIVSLLERFMASPEQTRHEVRVKLGVLDELAAEIFALTVFLCDDLLQLKPALAPAPDTDATRFFAIITKLPMELQMILCHRAVGSMKQNILRKDLEAAFKHLVRVLLSQPK